MSILTPLMSHVYTVRAMGQSGSSGELWRCLPRNLSYAEDGLVDNFSVSARFVRSKLKSKAFREHKHLGNGLSVSTASNDSNPSTSNNDYDMTKEIMNLCPENDQPSGSSNEPTAGISGPNGSEATMDTTAMLNLPTTSLSWLVKDLALKDSSLLKESPLLTDNPSSVCNEEVEEGVFMDMMEDLESSVDCDASHTSDDFSVDSINSPDCCSETTDPLDLTPLQEAVSQFFETDELTHQSFVGSGMDFTQYLVNISDRRQANLRLDVDCDSVNSPVSNDVLCDCDITDIVNVVDDCALSDHSSNSTPETADSPAYGEDEFEYATPKLRKSSSLKTNKTPPGTPHRKKAVRFADVMGLDLESVKHIMNIDSPPRIPSSALDDLWAGICEDKKDQGKVYLDLTFRQPSCDPFFLKWVSEYKVRLENVTVNDLSITGIIRVANIGFHKFVRVRYTTNSWSTYYDIGASYVQSSCDGPTDRFSFSIVAPKDFVVGCHLELAVSYTVNDVTFWDSNNGRNYVFECFAKSVPMGKDEAWLHFL